MKKIRKYCRVTQIDVLIFSIDKPATVALPALNFEVESKKISNAKIKYFINDQSNFVHSSILFTKLHVLKLIGKKGPAIGNCVTNPAYRGQSIYPIVIHQIASDLLRSKKSRKCSSSSIQIMSVRSAGLKKPVSDFIQK